MLRFSTAATVVFALVTAPAAAHAEGFYWGLKYSPNLPIGSVRNFAPNVTPLGVELDASYWFPGNFSIGVDGVYTRFYDTLPHGTYPIANGAITGTIYRNLNFLALIPEVRLYFNPRSSVVPYVGLGAGVSWATFQVLVSDIDVSRTEFGFLASPEAGFLFPYDRDREGNILQALTLGARYTISTAGTADVKNIQFLGLQVGALIY